MPIAVPSSLRASCALAALLHFGVDCRDLGRWLPTYKISRPVKLLHWTNWVGYNDRAPEWVQRNAPNCAVETAFNKFDDGIAVHDADFDISGADAVIFDASAMELVKAPMPREKPEGQLWIAFCSEAWSHNCRPMQDEAFISRMDGVASYDNRSAFPALFTPPAEDQLRRAPPDNTVEKSDLDLGKPLVTYYSGDCKRTRREEWVTSMIEALSSRDIGVRAYGECPKAYSTPLEPTCLNGVTSYSQNGNDVVEGDQEKALLAPESDDSIFDAAYYKWVNRCGALPFALIAENTDDVPWYVTEKLWVALLNGAVPIYAGPDEAKELMPPGSTIFASDYETPEALADAIVDAQQHLEDFHAWRQRPIEEWGGWREAQRLSSFTLMPRICEAISSGGPEHSGIDMTWRPPHMEMTRSFLQTRRPDIRWRTDDLEMQP